MIRLSSWHTFSALLSKAKIAKVYSTELNFRVMVRFAGELASNYLEHLRWRYLPIKQPLMAKKSSWPIILTRCFLWWWSSRVINGNNTLHTTYFGCVTHGRVHISLYIFLVQKKTKEDRKINEYTLAVFFWNDVLSRLESAHTHSTGI